MKSAEFTEILNELNSNNTDKKSEREWLVNVVASQTADSSLTSGTYFEFKNYCVLNDYYEEANLVTGQDSGVKGICLSNVKISLNRCQSSVQILKAFRSSTLLDSCNLIQIMKHGKDYTTISSILFKQCKITNVRISCDSMDFYFKYANRSETYYLVDQFGTSKGQIGI